MTSSTPSPTFSEDFDHWHEIDRITEKYREATQNEKKYIYENAFNVGDSKYKIITGFSAARNNTPAVRILMVANELINKTHHISFSVEEWYDFITYLKQFSNGFAAAAATAVDADLGDSGLGADEGEDEEIQFSNYVIKMSRFMGVKMLKVVNGFATFYMTGNTVCEFININGLVISNMNVLHSLDFASFYNNFLNVTNNILCESNYELCSENVLLNLCDLLPNSIQMHCIREYLYFNRNKVMDDLDRKIFILNA